MLFGKDELLLDTDTKRVTVRDNRVHLTGKEYQMLELLMLFGGSAVSKEMMLSRLYGGVDEAEMKIIDVFICKLRKKLADASISESNPEGKNYILTVWGRGYMVAGSSEPREGLNSLWFLRANANTLERTVGQLESLIADFESTAEVFRALVADEEDRTGIKDPRDVSYSFVAKDAAARSDNLDRSVHQLRGELQLTQELLAERTEAPAVEQTQQFAGSKVPAEVQTGG